jgi:hypothetical protein
VAHRVPGAVLFLLRHRRWDAVAWSGCYVELQWATTEALSMVHRGPAPPTVHGWMTESTVFLIDKKFHAGKSLSILQLAPRPSMKSSRSPQKFWEDPWFSKYFQKYP